MTEVTVGGGRTEMTPGRWQRVLVVALGGATAARLDEWMGAGLMPNLQRLAARGARAALQSVLPPLPTPAWASLVTGVPPAVHGVFAPPLPTYPGPARRERREVGLRASAVWHLLSGAGVRVGLVNVPLGSPPPRTMSFAVPERGAREYGGQVAHEDGAKAYARFLVRARRVTGQQARYGCRLLRRCEWDCCFVALPVLDRMQRRLWEVGQGEQSALVPEHEGLSARLAALVRVVDLAIGGLVAASGAVDVLVVSAHEVGPVRWQFRANQWLAESGLLAPARPPTSVFARVWRGLWAHPERSSFGSDIDWRGTSAYVESSDACGIRVNLRGREAGGAVAPGAPYEEVRARILEGLRGLRHPEANVPLFAAAFRREELGGGPGPSGAPDVICLVDDSTVALDPRLGGPRFARANHTGAPRPGGLLIAHGPRIEPGGRPSGARLVDFAPTLLRLFGLAAPDHMQGQVPEGLLIGEAGESAVPPPTRPGPAGTTSPYTDEEARQVEERLRGLGYL